MLHRIVQACRERLTETVLLHGADGVGHALHFRCGLLHAYERSGEPLDPVAAILPDARRAKFGGTVMSYVTRLGDMRLDLAASPIPNDVLHGAEVTVWNLLRQKPRSVPELIALGVDRGSVQALVFAIALTGRLERASQTAVHAPNQSGVMPVVRVSQKPVPQQPQKRRSRIMPAVRSTPPTPRVATSSIPSHRISGSMPAVSERKGQLADTLMRAVRSKQR